MLIKRYADASCEVLNILNHMNDDDLSKVSYKFIDFLKKNASCDYIPNLDFSKSLSDMNLKDMASLIYFFQLAAAYSALLLNVNPFDQPGVEVYKKEVRDSLAN